MGKKNAVKLKMFVKDGCGMCKVVKELLGGMLNDLSEHIDVQIITTNPKVIADNNLQYAPTLRFNDSLDGELIGVKITPQAILDGIRKLRFGTPKE